MAGVALSVLGVAGLLTVVAATEPLARRVRLPLSIVLVLVGAVMGFTMKEANQALMASLSLSS